MNCTPLKGVASPIREGLCNTHVIRLFGASICPLSLFQLHAFNRINPV
ncbi:MAG: hypothetical protein GF316_04435 [Candidatus Lokiarchaeota archaeon]|nr:hypothetical protein [Candidatus Lokiarchaeota archaeon]